MRVYIRNQEGTALIEKGKILTGGGTKKCCLLTGDDKSNLIPIGEYGSKERAEEILQGVMQRIIGPTAKEVQKGVIYIDLKGIK